MVIKFLFFLSIISSCLFFNNIITASAECNYNSGEFIDCNENYGSSDIETYIWDVYNITLNNSKIKITNHKFLHDVIITLDNMSYLDLDLSSNKRNMSVYLNAGRLTYRGGSTGKVDIFFTNDFQFIDDIYRVISLGNISTTNRSDNCNWHYCEGTLQVGIDDKTAGNITVDEVINGLTAVKVLKGSKLTINKFTTFDDRNGIEYLSGEGEIVFNDSTTIYTVSSAGLITINDGKILNISNIASRNYLSDDTGIIKEVSLSKGSSLYLLNNVNEDTTNTINRIQGEGNLYIESSEGNGGVFKVQDINIPYLRLNGTLVIENDTPYYTNGNSKNPVIRRIGQVVYANGSGELEVNGTLRIDNLSSLKKLTLCGVYATENCGSNSNLTIGTIGSLKELLVNNGTLNLELGQTNLQSAAISADKITFNDGILSSIVYDTPLINADEYLNYFVLGASSANNFNMNASLDNFTAKLPS